MLAGAPAGLATVATVAAVAAGTAGTAVAAVAAAVAAVAAVFTAAAALLPGPKRPFGGRSGCDRPVRRWHQLLRPQWLLELPTD